MTTKERMAELAKAFDELYAITNPIVNALLPVWGEGSPGSRKLIKYGHPAIPSYFNNAGTPTLTIDDILDTHLTVTLECYTGGSDWETCNFKIPLEWFVSDDPLACVEKLLTEERALYVRKQQETARQTEEAERSQLATLLVKYPDMVSK